MEPTNDKISTGQLTKVNFRLARDEGRLIFMGASLCESSYSWSLRYGQYPSTNFLRACPQFEPREGKFSQKLWDRVLALYKLMLDRLQGNKSKTILASLDPIDIAVAAFLVRSICTQFRHGHVSSPISNVKLVADRLQRKLERMRRRGVRKAKVNSQAEIYAASVAELHLFQLWARGCLLYCRCNRPAVSSSRRLHLLIVADCTKLAREAITQEGLQMPEPRELHKLVRLFLAYARRGRVAAGIPGVVKGDAKTRKVLGRFFEKHLQPQQSEP
jgi:hypothetical protein